MPKTTKRCGCDCKKVKKCCGCKPQKRVITCESCRPATDKCCCPKPALEKRLCLKNGKIRLVKPRRCDCECGFRHRRCGC